MAERPDDVGTEAPEGAPSGVEGVAATMLAALRRRRRGANPDPEFDAFLRKQSRLVDLQTEHLHEQRELILSRLRWGRFSDRMKALLQSLTVLMGLAIVIAIGAMAWQAREDHGVVIEAFSVPPDLAARGLTGQVVANKLLDGLAALQARTVTARPASTYVDDWGGDIKVEIPETGVSIGELNRYLRQWLGSETRISGEIVRTPAGIAVTARAGVSAGRTFEGSEAEIGRLIQQAAESVYASTQPYRWAAYLASVGRQDEALAAYAWLAEHGAAEDRAWAYAGWASLLYERGRVREALDRASSAIELDPLIEPVYPVRNNAEAELGYDERNLAGLREQLKMLESGRAEGVQRADVPILIDELRGLIIPRVLGDCLQAVQTGRRVQPLDVEGFGRAFSPHPNVVGCLANMHDIAAARRALDPPQTSDGVSERMNLAVAQEDWAAGLDAIGRIPGGPPGAHAARAIFLALLGRTAEADAEIASTPLDCNACLIARGLISGQAGDRRGLDDWFAEATRQAPSIPLAYWAWAWRLLQLGDADAAIVQAKAAHERGPHWADPLEIWGEALMKKGDYAGAAAKFAEADKYAPMWGKDHLRWGEALMLSGRYAEARAQYQDANGMDLSKPDRAALNVLLARTAGGPMHG